MQITKQLVEAAAVGALLGGSFVGAVQSWAWGWHERQVAKIDQIVPDLSRTFRYPGDDRRR